MSTRKDPLTRTCMCALVVLNLIFGLQVFAGQDANDQKDLFQMSLEELTEVNVVSASRLPTQAQYLSAPVTIITDRTTYMENDIEGQITFKPADDHTTSVGGKPVAES